MAPQAARNARKPSQLLALSFDAAASPSITLKGVRRTGGHEAQPYGWGFAWYPAEDHAAQLIKDPTSLGDNAMTAVLRDWDRFQSEVFVCHLRGAGQRIAQEDTQPFVRSHAGRDWLFAHNGDLQGNLAAVLPLGSAPAFEPVGRTESERAFCWLLTLARERGARRLADIGWERLHDWIRGLNDLGTANFVLTDGEDLVVHQDRNRFNCIHWLRRTPPHTAEPLESEELALRLHDTGAIYRSVVMFSTRPLSRESWRPMVGGQLLVARGGAVLWDSHAVELPELGPAPLIIRRRVVPAERHLQVTHETTYRYAERVERSGHLFRLRPVHDLGQTVLAHDVRLSVPAVRREFEDVFGNHAARLDIETPYDELRITSTSTVRIHPAPLNDGALPRRTTLPLMWMPWQRQMMLPYLLPLELPESQLRELSDYAMSFVRRQDHDLLETLGDINATIKGDYAYVPGTTSIETTPFEVYASRRGVCQDFANLFICLARLLNIPARYRVGYIFTGTDYENTLQSDASHAWAEVYIPEIGWRGFDPTNGCLAVADHVRVAAGRNYRDAAPTSGTLYAGGAGETLEVRVRVEEIEPEREPAAAPALVPA